MSNIIKNTLIVVVLLSAGIFVGVYGKDYIQSRSSSASVATSEVSAEAPVDNSGKTVAATVDGTEIYKEDVLVTIQKLGVKEADLEKVYPVVLNQLVTDKLMTAAVEKSGITKSDAYVAKKKELESQLAKTMLFEKIVSDKITEADLKKEYDKIKASNEGKKEARASHILVKTEEEAKQVIADLKKGADFAELAKQRSVDNTAEKGGDVGYFAKGEIVEPFADAAFALKVGQYTVTPVQTELGWHVIKLVDLRDRKVPAFEDVEASLRSGVSQKMVLDTVKAMREKADIKMYNLKGELIKEVADAPAPMAAPAK